MKWFKKEEKITNRKQTNLRALGDNDANELIESNSEMTCLSLAGSFGITAQG